MTDSFIVHDLYVPSHKVPVKTVVKPLTCYICKKELNGMSITAKNIEGRTVFLCASHLASDLRQVIAVS